MKSRIKAIFQALIITIFTLVIIIIIIKLLNILYMKYPSILVESLLSKEIIISLVSIFTVIVSLELFFEKQENYEVEKREMLFLKVIEKEENFIANILILIEISKGHIILNKLNLLKYQDGKYEDNELLTNLLETVLNTQQKLRKKEEYFFIHSKIASNQIKEELSNLIQEYYNNLNEIYSILYKLQIIYKDIFQNKRLFESVVILEKSIKVKLELIELEERLELFKNSNNLVSENSQENRKEIFLELEEHQKNKIKMEQQIKENNKKIDYQIENLNLNLKIEEILKNHVEIDQKKLEFNKQMKEYYEYKKSKMN